MLRPTTGRLAAIAALAAGTVTLAASAQAAPAALTPPPPAARLNALKPNLTATSSHGVVTITNTGPLAHSGDFKIGVWHSAHKSPDTVIPVTGLAPGAFVRVSPGTDGGTVVADVYNAVNESNESDNSAYARFAS
jgi:CARDB protein